MVSPEFRNYRLYVAVFEAPNRAIGKGIQPSPGGLDMQRLPLDMWAQFSTQSFLRH